MVIGELASSQPSLPSPRGRLRWLSSGPVGRVIVRRLSMAIPLLFVVTALGFFLMSLSPNDAVVAIVGPGAPESAYEEAREQLGLNLPVWEQYARWASAALGGDFGNSLINHEPVAEQIWRALGVTLSLVLGSVLISVPIGIALGVFSAVRRGVWGRVADSVALVSEALPGVWVGSLLILIFAVQLRILPALGYVPPTEGTWDWLRSITLPVVALAIGAGASIAKMTRESMLDVLGRPFITAARANGISRPSIIFRHALKNASMPVATVFGILVVSLMTGTVFVETVFAIPGLGSLAVSATARGDLPLIMGVTVCYTVIAVVVNLLVDLSYSLLNPRVRTSQ
jgi:peptide/nickel transport system permease protein